MKFQFLVVVKFFSLKYEKNTCSWRRGFIGRNITDFLVKRGDCYVVSADINKGTNWDILTEQDPKNSAQFIDDLQ